MYPILNMSRENLDLFINQCEKCYKYKGNGCYDAVIKKEQFTSDDILKLFEWKNGRKLSAKKKELVTRIIQRLIIINELKQREYEIKEFTNVFQDVNDGVWKVFLLHIISPLKYPIFDQHVYRAHMYLTDNRLVELTKRGSEVMHIYFSTYVPYITYICDEDLTRREVDKALFAFSQFLKSNFASLVIK